MHHVCMLYVGRLKAELASVSTSGSTIKGHVNGGGRFDVLLLALTARLSQWSQLERKSEEVRHAKYEVHCQAVCS